MTEHSEAQDTASQQMVYVVVARYYDHSNVEGVYTTEDAAEQAIEMSDDFYSYVIREREVRDEPQRHDPYF